MRATTFLACLVLSMDLACVTAAEPLRRGERPLTAIDADVAALTQVMKESRSIRDKIVGDLSLEDRPPVLYQAQDGTLDPESLRRIGDAIQKAVRDSGRYPGETPEGTGSSPSYLVKSGIVVVTRSYPELAVSEAEERSDLTVRIWICPDRLTAVALFWLRRGGSVPSIRSDPDDIDIRSASYILLAQPDLPGESTYDFSEVRNYSVGPPKGSSRAGGDRIGFLRGSVVAETSTWTYRRSQPTPEFRWVGMMGACAREVHALLRSLDSFILASERK